MKRKIITAYILLCLFNTDSPECYPFDGYPITGIRRLEYVRLIIEKKIKGTIPVPGARKSVSEIKLNLVDSSDDSLWVMPPVDDVLKKEIDALFPNRHESYSLALLDITPGREFRYAERQSDRQFSPGSVGKLAIAAGLFTELERLFPDSTEKRAELLRSRIVDADRWIHIDSHAIPVFNPVDMKYEYRAARDGDRFSLYEWIDHMLSASANSAGSTVWKEVMLMRAFGEKYPPTPEQEREFFDKTSRTVLRDIAMSTVNDPLRTIGIDQNNWQLGSFFTSSGKKIVPGGGTSQGTPYGLLQFLIALERGKIVDEWSSLEIKRLMYMTARRIRYASSPALSNAAVYFKSGSLYKCKLEPDFVCIRSQLSNIRMVVSIWLR